MKEHKAKAVQKVRCFVVTVSDTRDEATDQSGYVIRELLAGAEQLVVGYRVVRDEPAEIVVLLGEVLGRSDVDVVILNGGTGIAPRDGTYEVVVGLLDKRLDGFGELFRFLSYQQVGSAAMMSRAVAGVARGKIVVALPGSKAAVELGMRELILPELGHMVAQVRG